jgi:hypothetical protein
VLFLYSGINIEFAPLSSSFIGKNEVILYKNCKNSPIFLISKKYALFRRINSKALPLQTFSVSAAAGRGIVGSPRLSTCTAANPDSKKAPPRYGEAPESSKLFN